MTSTTADYPGLHNIATTPNFVSQYCDGSRKPPEFGASGWAVPPGISDATVPNPIFNLTPVATVDEGNNWINLRWGPLSLLNPVTNTALGNYALTTGSLGIIDTDPDFGSELQSRAQDGLLRQREAGSRNRRHTLTQARSSSAPLAPVAALSVTGGPLAFGNAGYRLRQSQREL